MSLITTATNNTYQKNKSKKLRMGIFLNFRPIFLNFYEEAGFYLCK